MKLEIRNGGNLRAIDYFFHQCLEYVGSFIVGGIILPKEHLMSCCYYYLLKQQKKKLKREEDYYCCSRFVVEEFQQIFHFQIMNWGKA